MELMEEFGLRGYISEPDRGRRRWRNKERARQGTYANRRRIRGARGRSLMRRRGELLERGFAHCLGSGGMRRTWLRGHENILKRYLVHVSGFNLGLVMRSLLGAGTPKRLASLAAGLTALLGVVRRLWGCLGTTTAATARIVVSLSARRPRPSVGAPCSTRC